MAFHMTPDQGTTGVYIMMGFSKRLQLMLLLLEAYNKSTQEESMLTPDQLKTWHIGKQGPKRHLFVIDFYGVDKM